MSLDSKKILGIAITTSSKEEILEKIRKYLKFQISNFKFQIKEIKPLVIFTPNPEIIEYAQNDSEFKKILQTADVSLPDGEGVVWAVDHIYNAKITRISGIDYMLDLCNLAHKETVRIGLIGGKGVVALRTAECLRTQYPGLKVEVFEAGEIEVSSIKYLVYRGKKRNEDQNPLDTKYYILNTEEELRKTEKLIEALYKWIEEKEIRILFVALGFPKQEYFIHSLKLKVQSSFDAQDKEKLEKPLVLMAVGGSFDYISGKISRAPIWMRENRLEWLYRLICEPSRIIRQLRGGMFFLRILRNA